MVLPAGVTKGTGLLAVLGQLGLSCHNAVAVGDAENDLAMLEVAEVGAVVANALGSLRRRADLVLDGEDGAGVAALADGPLLSGRGRLCPPRRWVRIGSFEGGSPVTVPGSQAKFLVTGPTGSGKSYLVGLLAEEWILAGYTILVVDPDGDHVGLARLTNVHVVDASLHLPPPVDLLDLMVNPFSSLVLDLSGLDENHKASYVQRLPSVTEAQRAAHGVPHWVVIDEAHVPDCLPFEGTGEPWAPGIGYCLSSYLPHTLSERSLESVDVTLTVHEVDSLGASVKRRAEIRVGQEPARSFTVAPRRSRHVRHEHKYGEKPLPPERRFYFHSPQGEITVASTLREFRTSLLHCDPGVLVPRPSRRPVPVDQRHHRRSRAR